VNRRQPGDAAADLRELLREFILGGAASNTGTAPAWRTIAEESRVRGFPSPRSFREWCYRVGVEVRDVGGVGCVAPEAVDRAFAAAPAHKPPPSARTDEGGESEQEKVKRLLAGKRKG